MTPTMTTALVLALVALVLALVLLVAYARALRWGAACTRCGWRGRALTLGAAEVATRRHAALEGEGHTCNLYRRE